MSSDPRATLRELYRGIDGFEITRDEERHVRASKGSPTYGEIMPTACWRLVDGLGLQPADVFFDLGAGVGKVVMMAALATCVGRCVGVELAQGRFARARRALRRAERKQIVTGGRVELRRENLLETDLSDATVVYTCSTAFPYSFTSAIMRRLVRLNRPVTFVSTQVLDEHRKFELTGVLRLDMSWRRRSKVYVYRVNG